MSKQEEQQQSPVSGARDDKRRKLVKGAALGVGGITLTHWSRPVVESVVLPVHAQTTGPSSPGAQVSGAGATSTTVTFGP